MGSLLARLSNQINMKMHNCIKLLQIGNSLLLCVMSSIRIWLFFGQYKQLYTIDIGYSDLMKISKVLEG